MVANSAPNIRTWLPHELWPFLTSRWSSSVSRGHSKCFERGRKNYKFSDWDLGHR